MSMTWQEALELARLKVRNAETKHELIKEEMQVQSILLQTGQNDSLAILNQLIEKAIDARFTDLEIKGYNIEATYYSQTGDFQSRLTLINKVVKRDMSDVPIRYSSQIYISACDNALMLKQPKEALQHIQKIEVEQLKETDLTLEFYYHMLGKTYKALGYYGLSIDCFNQSISFLGKEDSGVIIYALNHYFIGEMWMNLKTYKQALQVYLKGLNILLNEEPDHVYVIASLYQKVIWIYTLLGDLESAERYYTDFKNTDLKTDNILVLVNLWVSELAVLLLEEDYNRIIEIASTKISSQAVQELQDDPESAILYRLITAKAQHALGNLDNAFSILNEIFDVYKLAESSERIIEAYRLMAEICLENEAYAEAAKYYKKVDKLQVQQNEKNTNSRLEESHLKLDIEAREKLAEQATLDRVHAELRTLRSQMTPHFVFNTVTAIGSSLNENSISLGKQQLQNFAQLMRVNLEFGSLDKITLDKEIDFLTTYLEIEKSISQYPMTYQFITEIESEMVFIDIPTMLIQPLVENSIKHGIAPLKGPGNIIIHFKEEDDDLICTITDNGIGIDAANKAKTNNANHLGKATEITQNRMNLLSEVIGEEVVQLTYEAVNQGTKAVLKIAL